MPKFKKLTHKLLLAFLTISVVPIVIVTALTLGTAREELQYQAFQQLEAIRAIKVNQLQDYLQTKQSVLRLVKDGTNIEKVHAAFIKAFDKAGQTTGSPLWKGLARTFKGSGDSILAETGWHDFYLITADGSIVYSQTGLADLGANLKQPELANTSFGRLFAQASNSRTDQILVSDFALYGPADNQPAAFFMAEMKTRIGGLLKGYFAIRIGPDQINTIMQQREGMGLTGESYLVGADLRMRSDSFLDTSKRSVVASLAGTVTENGVDTLATHAALAGETTTKVSQNYQGQSVLSAFTPFQFGPHRWALVVEIEKAEAFKAIDTLIFIVAATMIGSLIVIVAMALIVSNTISRPLARVSAVASRIADGDLTEEVEVTQSDEIGKLEDAMKSMVQHLRAMINHIADAAQQQVATADELAASSEQTTINVNQQHTAISEMVSAIAEMNERTNEVSESTSAAAAASTSVRSQMDASNKTVSTAVDEVICLAEQIKTAVTQINALEQAAVNIGGILDVIKGIADQTNLLALNAAIEAARAGEQGRGFAVVADEVRALAQNTQKSAAEIETMIEHLQKDSGKSVATMNAGAKQSDIIVETISNISTKLTESQQAVMTISDMCLQISSAAEEQLSVAGSLQQNAAGINQLSTETGHNANTISTATNHLTSQAGTLADIINRFKL